MTKKERINYLDIAKGIGMILVVIGHVDYVDESIRQYITAFHMPLFFLISGVLIRYRGEDMGFKELLKKKFHSLMIPYALFSLLYFVIESLRLIIRDLDEWHIVFRQVWQSVCLQGVSALWFLPALFFSEILFVWIRKHGGHFLTIFGLLLLMGAMYAGNRYTGAFFAMQDRWSYLLLEDFLLMLWRNIFCVGLVGAGYYIGGLLLYRKLPRVIDAGGSLILLLALIMIAKYNTVVDLRTMNLGNPVLFLLGGLTGSFGVILACRLLESMPLRPLQHMLEYIGQNSLWIMSTHLEFRILYLAIAFASWIGLGQSNNILFCCVIVLFVFLMEVAVIETGKRIVGLFHLKRIKNS